MTLVKSAHWPPTLIRRVVKSLDSGAGTVIVQTNAGRSYLKAIGNPGGEQILACEWIGTQLASWLGLPTFDFSLIALTKDDEIPFYRGGLALPGPAFVTLWQRGQAWGGNKRQLKKICNPDDLTRLVVFDTWTRNCDRHSPDGRRVNRDNVFLSELAPQGQFRLVAMDHTHCFTCGGDLTPRLAQIGIIKDPLVYGLFPEFRDFLDRNVLRRALRRLATLRRRDAQVIVDSIPREWDVGQSARAALVEFLIGRAGYLVDKMEAKLWDQRVLEFPEETEERP